MSKWRGTIKKSLLEGGLYQLQTEAGEIYELEGSDPLLASEGAEVEIEGQVDRGALSFTMTGPRLKVKTVKAV